MKYPYKKYPYTLFPVYLYDIPTSAVPFTQEEGCQPVLFSKRRMEECGIAWSREGDLFKRGRKETSKFESNVDI